MADQYKYLEPTGVIVADTSATLAEVQSEFRTAFGADLIVTPDTPQGVLISSETIARNNVINNNAALANQSNPNVAGGVFLDAIMALTGISRNAQTPTVVTAVTVTGVAGTLIPEGSQASTSVGDLFETTAAVTIPSGGSTTVNFQSVAYGAIPCAANALNTIVTAIIGWETVDNTSAGVVGSTTQSDQAARAYRKNTLSFQAVSLAEAITSALYAVKGVTSLTFQENTAATTMTINSIPMVSHSIYACVEGGTNAAVAAALLENKSSGCAWNGSTSETVTEPASGQAYTVQFDRPTPIGILVKATVSGASAGNVIQAVLDYAAGTVSDPAGNPSNLTGFVVGSSVSPYEIAAAISIENPGCYVSNLQISLTSPISYQSTPIAIAVNEIATTQYSYVTVIIV